MYGRLLLESLRRGTRRKLLAVSAVALGTLGATALGEVMLASGDRLAAEMSSYGANLEVVPAREGETLPWRTSRRHARSSSATTSSAMAPLRSLRVRWAPGEPREAVAPLVGTWFDHALEPGLADGPAAHPADPEGERALAARGCFRGGLGPAARRAAGPPSGRRGTGPAGRARRGIPRRGSAGQRRRRG